MNYHNITPVDMLNGEGLRVVLWLSGCEMHCHNCHNPETWDPDGGLPFTKETVNELMGYLNKDYISGITFSGGHPLHEKNAKEVLNLMACIKKTLPRKTIWVYTGYNYSDILVKAIKSQSGTLDYIRGKILLLADVICDGPYIDEQSDTQVHWVGSKNQRVIDGRDTALIIGKYVQNAMIKQGVHMADLSIERSEIDKCIRIHCERE